MTVDFANSNLSKIVPKLRTEGKPTGNFGSTKRTREAYNSKIGETKAKVVRCVPPDEYLIRLQLAYHKTTDPKLKQFLEFEIKKINIKGNKL